MTPKPRPEPPYRTRVTAGAWTNFEVKVEQTDLFLRADRDLTAEARELVWEGRRRIEAFAARRPDFLTSLKPLEDVGPAPPPVREMLEAARKAGVGPMAAVAGALAEYVGRGLLSQSPGGVVVENGGDIFLAAKKETVVGLFAGDSPLSLRLGLAVQPESGPLGVCTSSGTVGHSLSFGRADAATVVARQAALADAAATGLGNRVLRPQDIEPSLHWALEIPGVIGAVVILKDKVGFLGNLTLVSI
ncbi:MAG: UPF0280 family protein [Pseudomonadota bacterium]